MNVALFSPNQNPYSETFIQAHKTLIKANELYYIYGSSFENMVVEGQGLLISNSKRIFNKVISKTLRYKVDFTSLITAKLKRLKVDVALIEYGNHAMILSDVLTRAGIPFIAHFHGYDASIQSVLNKNNNYKKLFDKAAFVIGVSKAMCERLKHLGCPEGKLVYNVYGANPIFETIKPHFNNKQILSVGRFVDKKAPYYTILAFCKVIKKIPEAKLIMVGKGMLLNTCKNLVTLYNLEGNIRLVGVKSPDDIKILMQESCAFVQHSVTAESGDQEGTPVAILEAALAGLPVISTIHAGIPDVIKHEDTGLLSNEHNIEAMANNIIRILEDLELAKKLGDRAKKYHKENYSMEKHINTIEDLLKKAIEN